MKTGTAIVGAVAGLLVLAAGVSVTTGQKNHGDEAVQLVIDQADRNAHLTVQVSGVRVACPNTGHQNLPWTCITTARKGDLIRLKGIGVFGAQCQILAPNRAYTDKRAPGKQGCEIAGRMV